MDKASTSVSSWRTMTAYAVRSLWRGTLKPRTTTENGITA